MAEQAKKEEENYLEFSKEFGVLIKEGTATDFTYREDLAKLLLFESTALDSGKLTGLDAYIDRMAKDQKEILFLFGKSRESIEAGPYLEAMSARGLEVLLLTEPVDEYLMQTCGNTRRRKSYLRIRKISNWKNWIKKRKGKSGHGKDQVLVRVDKGKARRQGFRGGNRRTAHRKSCLRCRGRRNGRSFGPTGHENDAGNGRCHAGSFRQMQVNPGHSIIRGLYELKDKDEETASLVADQLLDNAMASANLLDDPREMIARSYRTLEKTLQTTDPF